MSGLAPSNGNRVVVLSYDAPHRKTEDVIWKLLLSGYRNLSLVLTPWVSRPPRKYIYAHRPGEPGWPAEPASAPDVIASRLGLVCVKSSVDNLAGMLASLDPEVVVVGGAQLLPSAVVNGFKVLNVHPGLLPMCRGLDILKWSILEQARVGVTAHLCDDRPDLGRRIMDKDVPVYPGDTFHAFAARQYEMEIDLLPAALEVALHCDAAHLPEIPERFTMHGVEVISESRRRMPRRVEADLLPAFERYKLAYAVTP